MPLNLCSSFVLFNQKIFIEPGTCGSHLYSPTYTVGRDQEDRGSKLASGKKFVGPYLGKKASQKSAGGVAQEERVPA
jgi:hypothetical protein